MLTKSHKTSDIIREIIANCDQDHGTITLKEFLNRMGHRVLALAILVFSLLALVAGAIPGFSTVTGIPIIFMASQMVLGRRTVWLPKSLYYKTLSPKLVHGALLRSLKPLSRLEMLLKPRILWLTSGIAERGLGVIILTLSIILSLPIPAGNFLPSTAITILALAILERDGLLVIAALLVIALTGGVMIELIVNAWHYAVVLVHHLF